MKKGEVKVAVKKRLSQCEKILKYMKTHKGITGWQAYKVSKSMNLPQRIYDLRKKGVEIEDEYIFIKDADGEIFRVKEYRLVK